MPVSIDESPAKRRQWNEPPQKRLDDESRAPMYKKLKTPPRPPVDVTHLRRLTAEEQGAQSCDVRSRIAELSADPDRPIAVTEDHPHLGRRRMFLHAFNALFEHVPRVRASRLQKPNTKALHLHSAAYQWCRAETLYRRLCDTDKGPGEYEIEQIGMDFMEAAIVSVYGAVAAVDVFSQEVMFEKLEAGALMVGKPQDLIEMLRDCLPELTGKPKPTQSNWWMQFRNIHRARNSVTHSGSNNPDKDEELAKAWEALIAPGLDLPDVVRRAIRHFSDVEPLWVSRVIAAGRARADAESG